MFKLKNNGFQKKYRLFENQDYEIADHKWYLSCSLWSTIKKGI